MLKTIEGIYRNGQIELAEIPTELVEARVMVTFLPLTSINISPATNQASTKLRQPRQPGSAKGRLTILVEDDEHLADFQEYMPA